MDLVPIIGLLEESGVEYTASYTTKERDNIEVPVLPEPSSGDKTKTVKDVPLPALFHSISPGNEVTIFGRTAILRYVAEQFRLEYFYPKEASERATADLALDFYSTAFYPAAQSLLAKGDWASAKPTVETEAVNLRQARRPHRQGVEAHNRPPQCAAAVTVTVTGTISSHGDQSHMIESRVTQESS